jgi:thiamine monophosphate kinase
VPLIESEAGLIERLRLLFYTAFQSDVEVGIGDDAAVVAATQNKLVATVDMAVEEIHFKREWSTPFQIGAKLTTANLADIYAMGAITRQGAAVGDLVYLTALPGLSAAGLAILTRGLDRPRYVVEAHLNPKLLPPTELIKVATSMCDISDGLATDAKNLAKASGVDINLSKELIEKSTDYKDLAELANELGEDVLDWIISGGEDHFFLATVAPADAYEGIGIRVGKVEKGSGQVLLDGDVIKKTGYQHF